MRLPTLGDRAQEIDACHAARRIGKRARVLP